MDLLLKRDEKPGTFGTRFDLFAKLELEPQELAHVKKTRPERVVIMEDESRKSQFRWRLCLIPGAILSVIVSALLLLIVFGLAAVPFSIVLGAVLWFPCTKLIFNQVRPFVTVADLITGRTVHCKSLDDLYAKENEIRDKIQKHMGALKDMDSLGSVQRIPLKPE
jgi:hypothetical protein